MAAKKILMVEGKDDRYVLMHLCGNRNGPYLDEIEPYEGVNQLLESIHVRLKAINDGDIVGIVVDADLAMSSRWKSIRDQLINLEYENVPEIPAPDGTILDPPTDKLLPRVGIWIMPNNMDNGILEDFLKFLVPDNSLLFEHVKSSVEGIPENEIKFRALDQSKVLIHTWLAWQEKPGLPYGLAITAKFLDPDAPQVDILVEWLNRLFVN
ncbi:MAG: hypothetical protein NTY09_12755 [bacterium]|nr:hypothetical protein [bacterium]